MLFVSVLSGCVSDSNTLKPIREDKLPLRAETLERGLFDETGSSRGRFRVAAEGSLAYLRSSRAEKDFQNTQRLVLSRELLIRSISRLLELLESSSDGTNFVQSIFREFDFLAIQDGKTLLTSYYRPQLRGSRVRTELFRYPLFGVPKNLSSDLSPTRLELEGADGLQYDNSILRGNELVYLPDRLDAFLAQTQGSAEIELEGNEKFHLGFAQGTKFPYTSIGAELVAAGKLPSGGVTVEIIREYFRQHPEDLDVFLPRNNRFIFFKQMPQASPGNLGVPVVEGRSIAADQSIFPPGAVALMGGELPGEYGADEIFRREWRFVFVQDIGSAIRGPRRADLFLGSGPRIGEIAGKTRKDVTMVFPVLRDRQK